MVDEWLTPSSRSRAPKRSCPAVLSNMVPFATKRDLGQSERICGRVCRGPRTTWSQEPGNRALR
jgi:hypothetical protein